MDKYEIYAFSEVRPGDLSKLKEALGKNYSFQMTKSGYNDRLVLAYDIKAFRLIEHSELGRHKQWTINPGNYRLH